MSPRTRPTNQPPSPSNLVGDAKDDGPKNPIQQAHDLGGMTDTATFKTLWENLRQYHAHNSAKLKEFQYWVLDNTPLEVIPAMLRAVYGAGATRIESYGPSLSELFGVPLWQFVLFFGDLPQTRVKSLLCIGRQKKFNSFDSLYRELKRIRAERLQSLDDTSEFRAVDFRTCLKRITSNSKYKYENDSEDEYENNSRANNDDPISLSSDDDNYIPPSHVIPPGSAPTPALRTPNTRRRARDTSSFPTRQGGQGLQRQKVEPQVDEAGMLSDDAPMIATITVATTEPILLLGNIMESIQERISTTMNSAKRKNEDIETEHNAIESNLADLSEKLDDGLKSIKLLINSNDNSHSEKVDVTVRYSEVGDTHKRYQIERTRSQQNQEKRMKLNADLEELHDKLTDIYACWPELDES